MIKTDREQAQELMATYANAIDAKQYAAIAACFTPDATASYHGFSDVLRGRDEIAAHMRKGLESLDGTQHLFTNFIVDTEGDTGKLTAGIIAQHVRNNAPGGETFMAGNTYNVEIVRIAGAWRIARIWVGPLMWSVGNRDLLPTID